MPLKMKSQGGTSCMYQIDDIAGNNPKPPLLLAGTTEYVILPQKQKSVATVIVYPSGGNIQVFYTADLCETVAADILNATTVAKWSAWEPGTVTAETAKVFDGPVSALKFIVGAANCPVRVIV